MNDFLDSKTMRLLLVVFGLGLLVLIFATILSAFGVEVPYVREFYALLGGGGVTGTARNIVTDGAIRKSEPNGGYNLPSSMGGIREP